MKKKQTKLTAKLISLLLALAMLLTMQGVPALAETAGEAASAERTRETREMPKNPVHTCTKKDDGTDTTEWSYVYFGSYPQTEVTGDTLTAAITGASYDANGDAWVNGTKYRRISKSDTNYDSYFGDSEFRYFKWERIKWRVLNVNNSTMFVVADRGLDCKDYHDPGGSITWENCTLRNWLNNDFYGTAFSGSEQGAIVSQTVVNEDNPYYNIEGGNDTTDKVYLLSLSEAMNPDYGFCEDYSTYSASRRVQPSDYESGRQTVIWKFHRLQEIYGKLAVDFQDYGLECLKDTILLGIPEFIARYDIRYAPQETILTLDYPVLKDIRTLSGADAILEYVICIDYEQKFLKKFDASYVLEMLSAYQDGYEDMVENICGIVLQNMMGHLMLNKPLGAAGISREESERLSYFLEGKTKNEIRGFLETMLKNITESYLGGSRELYEYFSCAVSDLTARFSHNAKLHCLDKIVFF